MMRIPGRQINFRDVRPHAQVHRGNDTCYHAEIIKLASFSHCQGPSPSPGSAGLANASVEISFPFLSYLPPCHTKASEAHPKALGAMPWMLPRSKPWLCNAVRLLQALLAYAMHTCIMQVTARARNGLQKQEPPLMFKRLNF